MDDPLFAPGWRPHRGGAASAPVGDSASTGEVVASTQYPTTSTGLSRFVPEVEAVEAVEANRTTLRGLLGEARSGRSQQHLGREYPANGVDGQILPSLV